MLGATRCDGCGKIVCQCEMEDHAMTNTGPTPNLIRDADVQTMTDAELAQAYAHNVRQRGSIPTPFGPKRQARLDALLVECRVIRAEQHRRAGTRPLSGTPTPIRDADAERAMAAESP